MRRHADEDVAQVREGVDVVRLARADEGVERCDVVAGVFVADEEEVLPSQRDRLWTDVEKALAPGVSS